MKDKKLSLEAYLEDLQSQGLYWFQGESVRLKLGLSVSALRLSAYRLSLKQKLNRVRRDFYVITPPEYRAMGSLPVTWFVDSFMQYLGQPYYVGLLTAAALQGASHQQAMHFQIITDRRTRSIRVGNNIINFFNKKQIMPHFYRPIKTSTGTMNVSIPEMTAFDLVSYMNSVGQVNHVATILCELVEQLKPEVLTELLKNDEIDAASVQRLGFLLEALHLPIDLTLLAQLIKTKGVRKRLLVVGGNQAVIEYNKKWHVLVNERVEPDEL